jgi:hypothetical protein
MAYIFVSTTDRITAHFFQKYVINNSSAVLCVAVFTFSGAAFHLQTEWFLIFQLRTEMQQLQQLLRTF